MQKNELVQDFKNILIISDTHLTSTFNQKKFDFLYKLIESSDFVIINGDFFDGYLTTFNDFYASSWSKLFSLLKSKKAVYITGNHDPKHYSDDRALDFCILKTDKLILPVGEKYLHIEHGHNKSLITKSYMLVHEYVYPLYKIIHLLGGRIVSALNNLALKETNIELSKKRNKNIRWAYRNIVNPHHIFIMGHTHIPDFNLEDNYINSGFIDKGFASYVTITNGDIQFHQQSY